MVAALPLFAWGARRLWRGGVTLRGFSWTPVASRILSRLVGSNPYDEARFFVADGADARFGEQRRAGLERLATTLRERNKKSIAWGESLREGFSDLRFADANRVPPAFSEVMRKNFDLSAVATASDGPRLQDLDGHWNLDVSGSYGVNVAGYDVYKGCMERGWERAKSLGPVLGPVHPVVKDNIDRLREISGADEVSFHASGTEAVMAAVRLARFNTRRKWIVSFAGAYHGWWDGVQPGIGSERPIDDCLPLKDLDPRSLDVIRARAGEIAGVIVNPVQCFHPNAPPPNDAVLLTSTVRKTESATEHYRQWLHELRKVCDDAGVPLIFDEVYSGFRLSPGGAQEFFGVRADMVLYGKTVAGGMPIGVVCGRKDLMRRFDPDHPMRIAYVIGTFSAHPLVMTSMNEFLLWLDTDEAKAAYSESNEACAAWVQRTNEALSEARLPLQIAHLGTVWTILFQDASRYNWLLQYYLRAQGLALSWVGTGRCLASLDYTADDYEELASKILAGAREMKRDGWWLTENEQPKRNQKMKIGLVREMFGSLVRMPAPVARFYADIMQRKEDDHHASHHDKKNQVLHLLSSSVFVFCYGLAFFDLTLAMGLGLSALFVRQLGHAVFEPPCHDKEKLLLGFTTRSKSVVVAIYLAIPIIHALRAPNGVWDHLWASADTIALQWFAWTVVVVLGHTLLLVFKHGFRNSMLWFVKLVTDPFTDLVTYSPRALLYR